MPHLQLLRGQLPVPTQHRAGGCQVVELMRCPPLAAEKQLSRHRDHSVRGSPHVRNPSLLCSRTLFLQVSSIPGVSRNTPKDSMKSTQWFAQREALGAEFELPNR